MRIPPQDAALVRQACETSLTFLCTKVLWASQAQKDWAGVHEELARFLRQPGDKKLILLPRNHLKSAIVTQAWSIQQVLVNPELRVLISCNTWENARKFLGAIQKYLVQSPLSEYYGLFESQHWNQDECTIRQRKQILVAPTWATTGTEKQQTSQHYDLIIHDDLVDEENSRTPELREKVKQVYRNSWDLLEPGGRMIVMGTRKHQDDLYAEILDQPSGWQSMIRGAYADAGRREVIFPQKFTPEILERLRAIKGSYYFASEYLNNPIDEDAAVFKRGQIRYYEPGSPHPGQLYMTVDPALSTDRTADQSAIVVAGMFANRLIRVVDRLTGRWEPDQLIDQIFAARAKWNLRRIGIETFAFQKTLKYRIVQIQRERNVFFGIDEFGRKHTGRGEQDLSKTARIRRLQPFFEQGLIEIRRDMQDLEDELLAFPRGKNDDIIDALSYQLDYLVPSSERPLERPSEETIDEETNKYRYNLTWWLKQAPEKTSTIYDRFLSDLKVKP